jgi:hypothetical protein
LSGHGWLNGEEAARVLQFAAASGSRVRLPAAVLEAGDGVGGTAVRVAVDDLLSDLTPATRRFLDVVAVGRSAARVAAVEGVWARDADASSAGFDVALAELLEVGLVVMSSERLRMGVPIVGEAVAAQLGTGRAAALHVVFAEILARLEGVDPRESADHVRVVADRLPRALSTGVLIAAAERRIDASDPLGAAADLEDAAGLLEVAADGGSVADRVAAFDVLLALGTAYFQGGRIEQADATYRRAERFQDAVPPAKVADFEVNKTYVRADRGQPAAFPAEYVDPREGDLERPADIAVMRLFFVDRGDDPVALEAACAQLVALEGGRLPRLSAARPPSARRSAPRWRVTSSARHGIGILFGRHRIVERPVQVAERNGDSHPRNRKFRLVRFGHTR